MKLVGYVRVSTDAQAERGLGLETQAKHIRAWAKAEGHTLTRIVKDAGVSGAKDLEARDGLAEAFELLREGRAQGIVVYRLDRLARDLVIQEQLMADIWKRGCEILSTASGEQDLRDDPEDPSRKMMRQILGAVAEYERSMINLRLRRGRAAKAAKGGFAYGSPAFGMRTVNKELVMDTEEQAALKRMAALRDDGHSLRQIVTVLHAEGIPSKRGGVWHSQTVARALKRAS